MNFKKILVIGLSFFMISIVAPMLIIIFQTHYEQWVKNESSSIKVEKPQEQDEDDVTLPILQQAEIIDIKRIYPEINKGNCLEWPSQEIKAKGGIDGWDSFHPKERDIGVVVAEMRDCNSGDKIYLLKIEQYYVPIMYDGVRLK